MGAQNIIRVITEAGLAGEPIDLGADGVLKIIPILDNTHTLQIGNGTADMSFKVFLGGSDKYFLLDRATGAMTLQNVSFSISDLNVNSAEVNTIAVAQAMNTGPLTVNGNMTVTGQLSANTLDIANTTTFNDLTVNGTLTVNMLDAQAVTANTVTISGVFSPPDVNTNTVTANTLTADNVTVTNTLTSVALTVVPTVDDTGITTFGSATKSTDLKIFLGDANTYALFDRGATQFTLRGINVDTDSPMVVNAAITSDNTVSAAAFSGTTLSVTGDISAVNAVLTGTLTTQDITGTGLTIIPAVDDTGVITTGNATLAGDVKIFLGGAATFALFDRGNARLQLSSVELNTNAAIVSTGPATFTAVTAATVNTGDLNIGGNTNIAANTFTNVKFLNITSNTTVNASHYGAFLHSSGPAKTITLPTPVNKLGVWFDIISATANSTIIAGGTDELAVVGDANVNTVTLNAYGESVRVTNINTKWVVSAYEGTTLTTT